MKQQGMLTIEQLKIEIEEGSIATVILGFTDHYGRLLGKRFDGDFFLESIVDEGTHCCDYLLTTDMAMNPLRGFEYANWELGYGDFHLVPDLTTLRRADWMTETALVLCDVVDDSSDSYVSVAPRSILQRQLGCITKEGFQVFAASELEYYLIEHSYKESHAKNYNNLQPAGWYLEDYHILQGSRNEHFTAAARKHLKRSGIPVETSKGEWGLGQHELNVRYAEVLDMADRHVVFKQCLKELADSKGLAVTFMAKYHEERAGSSCHLHMSLWEEGRNAFDGSQDFYGIRCSELFQWFLGGWIRYAREVMPFYAPTVNSYKRYVSGSWAPTKLAWSYDNRTAGFRIVGSGASLRIECRIPGADCNPYLAFAASLACGMQGIKEKIQPPPIFKGDIYMADDLPSVPLSLTHATAIFEKSEFANSAFGAEVVRHYAHFYQSEQKAYDMAVTDWERRRYFEQI